MCSETIFDWYAFTDIIHRNLINILIMKQRFTSSNAVLQPVESFK